jgi:hypothetical protein
VGQFASLTQPVRGGAADAQAFGDVLRRKEWLNRQVRSLRFSGGDTGATNLASQGVVRRGLSILARLSPFLVSSVCDARKSRLTTGKFPEGSSGLQGRRFKSYLPSNLRVRERGASR